MPLQYVVLPDPGGPITTCPNTILSSSLSLAEKVGEIEFEQEAEERGVLGGFDETGKV